MSGRHKTEAFRGILAAFVLAAPMALQSCAARQTAAPASLPQARDAAVPCPPDECFERALALERRGGTKEAQALFKETIRLHPGTAWAGRASLHMGIMLSESGDSSSIDYFNEALMLLDIDRHVMFHLAGAERRLKLYDEAIMTYGTVAAESTGGPLAASALFRRAETLEEAGMPGEARDGFRAFIALHPRHRLLPAALLKAASLSVLLGDNDGALQYSRRVLLEYTADGAATKASEIREGLASSGLPVLPWGVEERVLRARGFFSVARYGAALEELSSVMGAAGGEQYADAAMLQSASLVRLKRYDEATASLKELLRRGAGAKEKEALAMLALIALRRADKGLLDEVEKRLASSRPDARETAEAMLYRAYLDESDGRMEKALSTYAEVVERFPSTQAAMEAVWKTLWIAYRSGRQDEAYRAYSLHAGSLNGLKGMDRLLYWAARSAEAAGMGTEARSLYERLCAAFRGGYYCQLAEDRTGDLGAGEGAFAGTEGLSPPQTGALLTEDSYIVARELILSGLGKDASEEISFLAEAHADDRDALKALAFMFRDAGDYKRTLDAYYRYMSLADDRGRAPAEIPELAYPAGAAARVREAAPEATVDEYLAASVMREESAFDPDAISPAGAIGLMQIMPDTGRNMALAAGLAAFDPAGLLDPDTNVRLGARYLAHLGEAFGWDLARTVAAYNAGPNAVRRWDAAGPLEADEFIESIPYRETRAYTKRVIESYGNYLSAAGVGARERWARFREKGGKDRTAATRGNMAGVSPSAP